MSIKCKCKTFLLGEKNKIKNHGQVGEQYKLLRLSTIKEGWGVGQT